MTIFVNERHGVSTSSIIEFHVNLAPEPATAFDDTVFATPYVSASLNYTENTWGGARPLGRGVWLVGRNSIHVLDSNSVIQSPTEVLSDNATASMHDDDHAAGTGGKRPPGREPGGRTCGDHLSQNGYGFLGRK